MKPYLDCNYSVLIHLAPYENPFGATSIKKETETSERVNQFCSTLASIWSGVFGVENNRRRGIGNGGSFCWGQISPMILSCNFPDKTKFTK